MKPSNIAWAEQAADFRKRAETLPQGEERDELLRRADQLDTAVDMTKMLSAPSPSRKR